MSTRFVFSAALSVLVAALVTLNLAGAVRDGAVDATFGWSGSCQAHVTSVGPGAAAAGLRPGDAVDTRAMTPAQRSSMVEGLEGGRAVLAIHRDGVAQTIAIPYLRVPPTPFDSVFAGAGIVVYLLTGAFVLFRGRDAASLGLGTFLMCFAASAFNFNKDGFLPFGPRMAADVGQFTVSSLDIYGAFVLNEALSRGILADATLRALRVAVVAYCAVFFVATAGSAVLFPLTGCVLPGYENYLIMFMAGALGVIAILGVTIVKARFTDHRLNWIFWTTVVCFIPYLAVRSASRLLGVEVFGDPMLRLAIEGIPFMALPIVYAYVILRYRVIDVSFVINRAIVYTALTTLVLGGVIIAETFAEKVALPKNAGLLLELAVPLALGISFDALQKRLTSTIDRILFRTKHRAEAALLSFAHDCAFVEKASTLRELTVARVLEQSRANGVALYERTETGYRLARAAGPQAFAGDVDGDDAAFVRMRATLGVVDLANVKSAIGREGLAFPLAVGGRLDGALVCAPRISEEPYAPDERDLLERVSQSVAAALAAMRARERAEFVAAVADGTLDSAAAATRARELRANG